MAQSGMTKVLLFGGAAVAAWWFFLRTPGTAAPAPGGPAPGAPPPATPPPAGTSAPGTLDAVYAKMVSIAQANGVPAAGTGPDGWNAYLVEAAQALNVTALVPAPDPLLVFPGVDRQQNMTATVYWAGMAPYLRSHLGLSGLGFFGLGALRAVRR